MSFAGRTLFGLGEESSTTAVSTYDGTSAVGRQSFGACRTRLFFESNGAVSATVNSLGTLTKHGIPSRWFSPLTAGIGDSYWIKATHVSGDTFNAGSSVGVWLKLNSARWWGLYADANENLSAVYTFEISSESDGTPVVATGDITIGSHGGDGPGDRNNL